MTAKTTDSYINPNVETCHNTPRLQTQKEILLERLMRGPVTNTEMGEFTLSRNARIHELRKDGHVITCKREGRGVCTYTLAS